MTSRLYAGFLMWGRHLTGHIRYHYSDRYSLGNAYNGLVRWQEQNQYNALVHPSLTKDEPTIGWELMREGVDDYRYIYTLELLLRNAAGTDKANRAAVISQDLENLRAAAANSGPKKTPESLRFTAARLHSEPSPSYSTQRASQQRTSVLEASAHPPTCSFTTAWCS